MRRAFLFAIAAAVLSAADSQPVRVAQNIGAGEGPVWRDGYLWFTGKNGISRRHFPDGKVEVWKDNTAGANGLLFDREGRLIVCEATARRIVRYDVKSGAATVLADRYHGRRFNSPNDLTIDAKGRIYFSDPRYGKRDGMEQPEESVYRIDAPGTVVRVLGKAEGVDRPNGVLISHDGAYLYVADNNNSAGGPRKLFRFRLRADGSVDAASKRMIYDWGNGRGPDGLKSDRTGRLFVAAGRTKPRLPDETDEKKGGIYVFNPDGKFERMLPVTDDEVTNCAFGGADGKTLFITAGGSLWSVVP